MATDLPVRSRVTALVGAGQSSWTAVWVSAVLILAVAAEVRGRGASDEKTAYHARIKALAAEPATIPFSVGNWIGSDGGTSPYAVTLLKPTALVNRVYRDTRTSESATLMFVHCSDARSLQGHYPPACYPGQGYLAGRVSSVDWNVGGTAIQGTRYRFRQEGALTSSELVVDNFMVLPTGKFGRDMDAVDAVARDPSLRRLGAAQVQVVTDGTMSDIRRDEVFRELVGPIVPLLNCVGDGIQHD